MNLYQHPKSPHLQLVKFFEHDLAAVAASHEAIHASVSQIMGPVQEFSKRLDAISLLRRFDDLCKDSRLRPELNVYAKGWTGYGKKPDHPIPDRPAIESAVSVEDKLIEELQCSNLPDAGEIVRLLRNSKIALRNRDINGCLVNARVALETVARSIARACFSNRGNFGSTKWGRTISRLSRSGFITRERGKELTSVYDVISRAAHSPISIKEKEFVISNRDKTISLCYFLAKQFNAIEADS